MVRTGTVSSVDSENKTARVAFSDRGDIVSYTLIILDRGDEWIPDIGAIVYCLFFSNGKGDGLVLGGR